MDDNIYIYIYIYKWLLYLEEMVRYRHSSLLFSREFNLYSLPKLRHFWLLKYQFIKCIHDLFTWVILCREVRELYIYICIFCTVISEEIFFVHCSTILRFLLFINLRGLFNAEAIFLDEQQWCYLTHSWDDKSKCLNAIARLDFELAHYDFAVQRFNHYTTRTPLRY